MRTRPGKRERAAIKMVQGVKASIIAANVANMATLKEEARLCSIRSSANPLKLKVKTHMGYADNLHTKGLQHNAGSCRVDNSK